jgi:hypothetical protein
MHMSGKPSLKMKERGLWFPRALGGSALDRFLNQRYNPRALEVAHPATRGFQLTSQSSLLGGTRVVLGHLIHKFLQGLAVVGKDDLVPRAASFPELGVLFQDLDLGNGRGLRVSFRFSGRGGDLSLNSLLYHNNT